MATPTGAPPAHGAETKAEVKPDAAAKPDAGAPAAAKAEATAPATKEGAKP
jgi:hypothetical protein